MDVVWNVMNIHDIDGYSYIDIYIYMNIHDTPHLVWQVVNGLDYLIIRTSGWGAAYVILTLGIYIYIASWGISNGFSWLTSNKTIPEMPK